VQIRDVYALGDMMHADGKESLVVNLFGSPGVGKSTIAADVYAKLNYLGIPSELATEFAKDCIWLNDRATLNEQAIVWGNQLSRIKRLLGKVMVVVSDSPTPLSIVYKSQDYTKHFDDAIMEQFGGMRNLNFLIARTIPYIEVGRKESKEEAERVHHAIKKVLDDYKVPYETLVGLPDENAYTVVKRVLKALGIAQTALNTHRMHLDDAPFEKMRSGEKTVEVRVYDEKRMRVRVGDTIVFSRRSDDAQKVSAEVVGLSTFGSFRELLSAFEKCKFGHDPALSLEDQVRAMREHYTEAEERENGVVAMHLRLLG
jgi:ASC-1-like (ASCH) protein/adenylate kinase family enzyme